MELYKYVNSDRIDILLKGKIRFSQPSVWNDPFESKPYYKDHRPRKLNFFELLHKFQETNIVPTKELEEYEKERKRITRDDIYKFIHENIIGLSLTEDKDNLLMWAHYASNHSGFVIEFDTKHNFFHGNDKYLFKVECNEMRPEVETNEFASLIVEIVNHIENNKKIPEEYLSKISRVFRKSTDWIYEKEWRLITTSNKAINYAEFKDDIDVINLGGDKDLNRGLIGDDYLAFLEIPISSIKAIYCGNKMKSSKIRKLFFLTKYNPIFSHIKLMRAEIDDILYKLNYVTINAFDVLTAGELIYESEMQEKRSLKNKLNPFVYKYEKEKRRYKKIKTSW